MILLQIFKKSAKVCAKIKFGSKNRICWFFRNTHDAKLRESTNTNKVYFVVCIKEKKEPNY